MEGPETGVSQLNKWNIDFALELFQISKKLKTQYVTFGTLSETFLNENSSNPYTRSKRQLTQKFLSESAENWLHIRLHTLYGVGHPSHHSFLGGIYRSLSEKSIFRMTSGLQLREYHHFFDDCSQIHDLMSRNITGLLDLNANNAIQLRELALSLFEEFNQLDLLKIDSRELKVEENLQMRFANSQGGSSIFREPVLGVTEYFKQLGLKSE